MTTTVQTSQQSNASSGSKMFLLFMFILPATLLLALDLLFISGALFGTFSAVDKFNGDPLSLVVVLMMVIAKYPLILLMLFVVWPLCPLFCAITLCQSAPTSVTKFILGTLVYCVTLFANCLVGGVATLATLRLLAVVIR